MIFNRNKKPRQEYKFDNSCLNPSTPIANPTKLADIIANMFKAPPNAQIWRCHCPKYLRLCSNVINLTIPISGTINKAINQPQANNIPLASCQYATNEKIAKVLSTLNFRPPNGIYTYLTNLLALGTICCMKCAKSSKNLFQNND